MLPLLLQNFAFQVQRLVRGQPILSAAIVGSVLLTASAAVIVIDLQSAIDDESAFHEQLMRSATEIAPQAQVPTDAPAINLLPFNSAHFVQALDEVSQRVEIPLNEVSFALVEMNGLPFQRYRASFSVNTRYLALRRFIDDIHGELRDVSLDSIACTREKIDTAVLKCDLVFSGFYAKDHND